MKQIILISLIIVSKLSVASFPVLEKTTDPESSLTGILSFIIMLILCVLGLTFNQRKYGTFYNPNNKREAWLWKYKWIILLGIVSIAALGMSAL